MSQIKKRQLYQYPCVRCGNKASSLKAERAIDQLCRKCRKLATDPNQSDLFAEIQDKA